MKTERKLLLACLQFELGSRSLEDLSNALQAKDLDSKQFAKFLLRHRLVQQVYATLKKAPIDTHSIENALKQLNLQITLKQLANTAQLTKIVAAFEEQSISFICLKGSALGVLLYGAAEKRQSNDIDILVQESDLRAAESVLAHLGFKYDEFSSDSPTKDKFEIHKNHTHHLHFSKGDLVVEVHWKTSSHNYLYPKPFEELYQKRTHIPIANQNVPFLSTEDLIAYLHIHGIAHCWNRMKLIYEVALLRQKDPQVFDTLTNRPEPSPLRQAFKTYQALSHQLFDYGPSPQKSLKTSILTSLACSQMLGDNELLDSLPNTLGRSASIFLTIPDIPNRIRYTNQLLSWTPLYHKLPLPKYFHFVYPLISPALWFCRAIRRVFTPEKRKVKQ
ncbi:nucleotidyltransferase family protein [Puniceicoccaceae bacterium K14]|nr:nucleotidyltransferase family protein [Puniceicoccaceae bacterium K14]